MVRSFTNLILAQADIAKSAPSHTQSSDAKSVPQNNVSQSSTQKNTAEAGEKVWVNTIREQNLASLNEIFLKPPKPTKAYLTRYKPIAKNIVSQGISFSLFYFSGNALKAFGIESSQLGQVGLFALGDLLREQKNTIEELFVDRLFGGSERQDTDAQGFTREGMKAVHDKLILRDSLFLGSMPNDIQSALKTFDENFKRTYHDEPSTKNLKLRAREGLLKAIPRSIFDVSHQTTMGDPVERARIDGAIKNLIQRYPDEMHAGLRAFTARIRANCFKTTAQFSGAYLYGQPGTGKTYFARNLAKALGLPLIEFSLHDASESKFFGAGYTSSKDAEGEGGEEKVIGKLAFAVIKSGILNPIVYFDEGGDNLSSGASVSLLKKMMDPENQKKAYPALGDLTLDLSRVTFMMSGNDPLENAALKRRIKEIEFKSLPEHAKRAVIAEDIAARIANHSNLSPDIFADFEKHVNNAFDEIIRQDFALKSPGVAVAQQVVEDVVNYVTDILLAAEKVDTIEINKVIEDGFKQRLPSQEK